MDYLLINSFGSCRLFNIFDSTVKNSVDLSSSVRGLLLYTFHALEDLTFKILTSLIQVVEPLPQNSLGFGTTDDFSMIRMSVRTVPTLGSFCHCKVC